MHVACTELPCSTLPAVRAGLCVSFLPDTCVQQPTCLGGTGGREPQPPFSNSWVICVTVCCLRGLAEIMYFLGACVSNLRAFSAFLFQSGMSRFQLASSPVAGSARNLKSASSADSRPPLMRGPAHEDPAEPLGRGQVATGHHIQVSPADAHCLACQEVVDAYLRLVLLLAHPWDWRILMSPYNVLMQPDSAGFH